MLFHGCFISHGEETNLQRQPHLPLQMSWAHRNVWEIQHPWNNIPPEGAGQRARIPPRGQERGRVMNSYLLKKNPVPLPPFLAGPFLSFPGKRKGGCRRFPAAPALRPQKRYPKRHWPQKETAKAEQFLFPWWKHLVDVS
ncbi:hypothetical protein DXA36_25290 [Eisenbergiella sp. OF01-20]|nr:hypothetical protein DXA36_25290 [Eisenbergiella sp. OF01-20]